MLAGAVAKGGYEAGALEVLAGTDLEIVRIVATSAGALNAVAYARGVRARDPRGAASLIAQLWRDEATFTHVFQPSLGDLLRREGFSDHGKLLGLLREHVTPVTDGSRAEIELRLIYAPLAGADGEIGERAATTYEHVAVFEGSSFDSAAGLEPVFATAVASASLPFAFTPFDLPGHGPCIDGGAVNNTPIKWALGTLPGGARVGPPVEAVLVISPIPELAPPPAHALHGLELASHLVEMLINERLYRDLREAEQRNEALRELAKLPLDPQLAARVIAALDWDQEREIPIVAIRPRQALPGNAFTGFFDRSARESYITAGRRDAEAALRARSWLR